MKLDFDTLRAANATRQKEWDTHDAITLAYRSNELAGEIGEALERAFDMLQLAVVSGRLANIAKKLERERYGIRGNRATKEDLAEELSDTVICADLLAMKEGIDLGANIAAKFNATSERYGLATRIEPLTPAGIHNRDVGGIVKSIVEPTINAGGEFTDVMVVLESVITGVMLAAVQPGGDEEVLGMLSTAVTKRLHTLRKLAAPAEGNG